MKANQLPTVLLADADTLGRFGLRGLIESSGLARVVSEAGNGPDAVAAAQAHCPDFVIAAATLPGLNGEVLVDAVKAVSPNSAVALLGGPGAYLDVHGLWKGKAVSCFDRASAPEELVDQLRRMFSRDEAYVSSAAMARLATQAVRGAFVRGGDELPCVPVGEVTPRERQIIQLVAEGCTNEQIASALQVSEVSVGRYRQVVMDKLGLHTAVGLARFAYARGIARVE